MTHILRLAAAVVTSVVVLAGLALGYRTVPALGPVLVPGRGVWAAASTDPTAQTGSLSIHGLSEPVTVSFDAAGYADVQARTDDDLFTAQGYISARFRLTQMDLERRVGTGRLSELNGPNQLASDMQQLRLGLGRTAQAMWLAMPPDSPAARALIAYARGVNQRLAELGANGQWPLVYQLTGVRPQPWTPVDSLVVQLLLTEQLAFNGNPLDYTVLDQTLGPAMTASWFPAKAVSATADQPYDPGPYRALPPTPFTTANANAADPPAAAPAAAALEPTVAPLRLDTATRLLGILGGTIIDQGHQHLNSNAWAINGPRAAGGGAMLAGDPHLQLSLPSYWFENGLHSPGYDVSGASLPGLPGVLLGRNQDVSWSITNAASQPTFFYVEATDPARPGEYWWRGAWRRMQQVDYEIPVHGGEPVRMTVDQTVHGPALTANGQTVAISWVGDWPSNGLASVLAMNRARSAAEFREALRGWRAPALNFVYADRSGTIGAIGAGSYPQTAAGAPERPMPGTGEFDLVGDIPFEAVPHVVNPPDHMVVSTNQRPVGPDYPYFIGTSMNFDPGHRQAAIRARLAADPTADTADLAALQNDVTDELARRVVPSLLAALGGTDLTGPQQAAAGLMARWNSSMDAQSAAASIWYAFLGAYLKGVFGPWWTAKRVPTDVDPSLLDLSTMAIPFREALEHWTLNDPGNAAFSPPGGPQRDAPAVMRAAFNSAVAQLSASLGPDPTTWTWGRLHQREVPSFTGADALGYGPYPAGGDPWTVDAAGGGMTASFGPTWRLVVAWENGGAGTTEMIYPGGQSEDPTSPWYDNLIPLWRDGRRIRLPISPRTSWTLVGAAG